MKTIDFINVNRPSYNDDMNVNNISQKTKLESKKIESNLYQYPKDIIDINYANNKELISTNGDKVNFKYNKNGIIVTVDKKDIEHQIKSENLPSELKQIHNPEQLNKFLDKAYVNVKTLSDGDIKVDVNQKLEGGVWQLIVKNVLGALVYVGVCDYIAYLKRSGDAPSAEILKKVDLSTSFLNFYGNVVSDIKAEHDYVVESGTKEQRKFVNTVFVKACRTLWDLKGTTTTYADTCKELAETIVEYKDRIVSYA